MDNIISSLNEVVISGHNKKVRLLLAEAKISSLLQRERFYRDHEQWENLRQCYHPDTSRTFANVSWYNGDIEGFINGSKRMNSKGVIHNLTPRLIDVRGTRALARSIVDISIRETLDSIDYDAVSLRQGLSRLELVEIDGLPEWRMLTLEVMYIRDSIVPAAPLTAPSKLDFDCLENARKSYKYLTWHVQLRGGKVRDDLPGEDDEDTVKAVLDKSQKWIEEVP